MTRPWLLPLAPLYRAGLWVKERLMGEPKRLPARVVSVGSLSAGGAGKTPMVMLVVEMLRQAGLRVDVLSRGYGRTGTGVEQVDVAGLASRFGDEPMLMARRLGVPVWVGADRFAAGRAAEDVDVHVLDDGFQHRRLGRDCDVVLLTRRDVEDALLPAGDLREPLSALGRADVVVLREEEAEGLRGSVPEGKRVWVVRRSLRFDVSESAGKVPLPQEPFPQGLKPRSSSQIDGVAEATPFQSKRGLLVFCGIARPEGFVSMLEEAGVPVAGTMFFADHHAFGVRDVTRLIQAAKACGADGFCTTEKDAVKLTPAIRTRLEEVGPLVVAELRVELVEGDVGDVLGR